jgi:hypothetical protein
MNHNDNLLGLVPKSDVKLSLGVCDRTLARWAKTGYLPRVRVGKGIYYRVSDLKKLTKGGEK